MESVATPQTGRGGQVNVHSRGAHDVENQASHPRWVRNKALEQLSTERLARAKKAFTTRRVPFDSAHLDWSSATLISGPVRPRSGDLVLARVDRIGHHGKLELTTGRRSKMHVGDEIVVTYGDRYAPDQFEAEIPKHLRPTNLLASGGVAGTVLSRHESARRATDIVPIGLIGDASGSPLNISRFAIDPPEPTRARPRTVAVIGTSMNAGKTTTVSSLVMGLRKGGRGKPGATKVTGTGSGADYWAMVDAGAYLVADFTDAGLASTYRVPYDVVEANFVKLIDHLTNSGCTEIVVEIADGIFQRETARLMQSEVFRSYIDLVVFAAADSMGAVSGVDHLRGMGLPLVAVSGVFTRSPLAVREVQANCPVPVLSRIDLTSGSTAAAMLAPETPIEIRRVRDPDRTAELTGRSGRSVPSLTHRGELSG